jgi:hypothetical protein
MASLPVVTSPSKNSHPLDLTIQQIINEQGDGSVSFPLQFHSFNSFIKGYSLLIPKEK